MSKAFPWLRRDGADARDPAGERPEDPRLAFPDDAPARLYGAQLTRVESTLNSLLATVTASAEAPDTAPARPRPARPHPTLGAAVAEVARRQKELEELSRLRQQQAESRRPPASSHESPNQPAPRSGGIALAALQDDIATLAAKLDDMRREQAERQAQPPVACNLDKLRVEIATMSEALRDLASRGSIATLEASIRTLSQRIETSRTEGIGESALLPLERLIGELRHSLAELDPRTTIKGLEGELKKLGTKIDDLGKAAALDPAAVQNIERQTQEIRDLLSAAIARPQPLERIEEQVAQLAEHIDHQRMAAANHRAGASYFTDDSAHLGALGAIEARLDSIAAKVEEVIGGARDQSRYEALSNRIDEVHRELATRIAEKPAAGVDTRVLEDLVCGLADKLEQAQRPQADHRAIEALEQQIGLLAERLDRSNAGISSLTSLERMIGELFGELEKTRQLGLQAAENAARNVIQETFNNSQAGGFGLYRDVGQELQELRVLQDETDRRTLSTLNAVHETLEKVVDRLAMVEEELSDKRPGAGQPEMLASGPAPVFAPPAPRDPAAKRNEFDNLTARREPPPGNSVPPNTSLDDFLIEPGSGFPGRRDSNGNGAPTPGAPPPLPSRPKDEPSATRADFIAAARRAAQAAQLESAAAIVQSQARATAPKAENNTGIVEQARDFIAQHKRPVVLSLAALFVAVGAYAVLKTMGHTEPAKVSYAVDVPAASEIARPLPPPSPPPAAPVIAAAPARDDSALSPNSVPTPPVTQFGAPQAIPGSDPVITGSIESKPKDAAAPAAAPQRPLAIANVQSMADAGDARAQFSLALDYAEGRHVSRDFKMAAQWFEKAALQGLAPAQYRLASFYEKGIGVARDTAKAKTWYQKAAERGNVRAMHNLAVLAADGGDSGRPDYATAAQWFKKAAAYGVRDSQYNIAVLFARGLGVSQDLVQSYTWFAIAAAQGDDDAGKKRDDVAARLTDNQIAAAKAMAAAFHPKTPDPDANDIKPAQTGLSAPPPVSRPQKAKMSML